MINKQLLDQLTSKNYKVYLLFLILTCIFWFTIQMVKTYNYKSEILVEIGNIPNHIVVDTSVQKVDVNIKANGFKLWSYNLKKAIKIPYQDFKRDSTDLSMTFNQLKANLSKIFEIESEDINLNLTLLKFKYRKKQTKKVNIKPDIKYTFSQGYNTLDSIILNPDSIVISGSNKYLKDIQYIKTEALNLKNISDTLNGEIGLKKPNQNIDLSSTETEYSLPVEKFSEKAIMVDIKIINEPDSLEVNIFPNQAKVSFLVSLNSFDKISGLDFNIIVDYEKRFQKDAVIIPEVKAYPNNILKPKLHVKKVDYLIRQKNE